MSASILGRQGERQVAQVTGICDTEGASQGHRCSSCGSQGLTASSSGVKHMEANKDLHLFTTDIPSLTASPTLIGWYVLNMLSSLYTT